MGESSVASVRGKPCCSPYIRRMRLHKLYSFGMCSRDTTTPCYVLMVRGEKSA